MNDNTEAVVDAPTDNVISLGTRKPLAQVKAAQEAIVAAIAEQKTADQLEATGKMLDSIDKLRDFVASGRCGGLVFMTQETATGLFLSDVILPRAIVPTSQLFGWAGLLGGITAEIGEYAALSPQLMMDGSISDPDAAMQADFDEEFDQ